MSRAVSAQQLPMVSTSRLRFHAHLAIDVVDRVAKAMRSNIDDWQFSKIVLDRIRYDALNLDRHLRNKLDCRAQKFPCSQ